ncbi:MAG: ribose-phosphate diphosphokinase [Treponema sp.]|nr:ribose-phosphate diphosphokinase [Treponema sp.]
MNEFIVTATRSMCSYASRVAEQLAKFPSFTSFADSINGVGLLSTRCFADGEMEVVVNSSIRGKNVILFASCARNEAKIDTSEAKIELYHAVDALKRSQAEKIIVFEPFVSCSRSDRNVRRSSVGLWMHFNTLRSVGVDQIVTYQLHSDKSKSMVDPTLCAIDDIPALTLLKRYLCDVYIKTIDFLEKEVRSNWAFCSVDAGGEKLARGFANAFGAPLVVAHKQRDYSKENSVDSVNILSAAPLKDKVLWIVDDMVDTAASVEMLILALEEFHPAEVNLLAVHAVFSPPAATRLNALIERGSLNRIMVTDTVNGGLQVGGPSPLSGADQELIRNLEVVPSSVLSAKVINTIISNNSMDKLLRDFNAEIYLKSPKLFNR